MVNRDCPKCGQPEARVRHNRAMDQLELECSLCRYEWLLKPLDVVANDEMMQIVRGYDLKMNRAE